MRRCENCNVEISDRSHLCPLCQGELTGEKTGERQYPKLPKRSAIPGTVLKLFAFFGIVGVAICFVICIMLGGIWWLYTAAAFGCAWIIGGIMFVMRHNAAKCIIWTTAIISLEALGWDFATGYSGWSLDIVLPIACCCAMLTMALVARIKRQRIEDYIIYLIIDIIFGIIPFVLFLCGLVHIVLPSVICVAGSAISLAALLIFEGKPLIAEIIRRTHM